jgi:hypothetical protein
VTAKNADIESTSGGKPEIIFEEGKIYKDTGSFTFNLLESFNKFTDRLMHFLGSLTQ